MKVRHPTIDIERGLLNVIKKSCDVRRALSATGNIDIDVVGISALQLSTQRITSRYFGEDRP
ncbi:hypothetical protein EMIT0P4_120081 [Pseudomonas sp. IT-P4]